MACALGLTARAHADGPDAPSSGADGPDALAGTGRVGWATPTHARLSVLGAGGYGFIEGAPPESGDHHRAQGSLAASIRPIPWLAIALGAVGRWDVHPDDANGADASGLGYPWLVLRGGAELAGGFSLGADARLDVHAGSGATFDPLGSRLQLRGLATFRTDGFTIGVAGGVQLDGTGANRRSERPVARRRRGLARRDGCHTRGCSLWVCPISSRRSSSGPT